MKAIFYDRKNKLEVTSEQLKPIKLVRNQLCYDHDHEGALDSLPPGADMSQGDPRLEGFYVRSEPVAELGYRSEKCPTYVNWDLSCNLSDLVFLKLDE